MGEFLTMDEKILEVPKRFFSSGKMFQFNKDYPDVLAKFIFNKIKKSIKNEEKMCKLYKVKNTNVIAVVVETHYMQTLQEVMESFISVEQYELANEVKNFMDEYAIDKLISESSDVK
ncbi:MAG: hypothetical protein VW683_00265 [Betaproteobacteria bacterium]|jgi:hypothetical protein